VSWSRPISARPGRKGFTLVELLVVIMIAVLLMSILLPTLARVRTKAMVQASMATVATLETACQLYHQDNRIYPPSGPPDAPANAGGQLLALALTGYADASVDGYDGYGWKKPTSRRVYGPYNETEKLRTLKQDNLVRFVDRFDRPFLYYRYDRRTSRYNSADNGDGPSDINAYARGPDGRYFRSDFLILSAGPDAIFQNPYINGKPTRTDDITNFLEQ